MPGPTPTAAPPPFPGGDPRNGKYFEQLAALEHQRNNALAGDKEALTSGQSAFEYNTGQLDRQLPLTLQGTRNTANAQGLLESGQLAQRAGGVERQYAERRGRLASNWQQTQDRVHREEANTEGNFNLGRSHAAAQALEEAKAQLELQAPNEPAPAPPPAAAAAGVPQFVNPRGTPQLQSTVRARRPTTRLRRQAARRAVG